MDREEYFGWRDIKEGLKKAQGKFLAREFTKVLGYLPKEIFSYLNLRYGRFWDLGVLKTSPITQI